MFRSGGIQKQLSATIRAKETNRARGKRESTLHRRVLVSTRLLVPDYTKLLNIRQQTVSHLMNRDSFSRISY